MATLYVLMGIPASGKSLMSDQLVKEKNCRLFSSDIIREEMKYDASVDAQNDSLFDYMYARIREELDKGVDIVLDATNTYAIYREKIFRAVGHQHRIVCILLMRQYDNCLKANRQRAQFIKEDVIYQMYSEFDLPSLEEGFEQIEIFYPDNDEYSLKEDDWKLTDNLHMRGYLYMFCADKESDRKKRLDAALKISKGENA